MMKPLLFACISCSSLAQAKTLSMICHPQKFWCFPDDPSECFWQTAPGSERRIELEKDPRTPSPTYPHELWQATFRENLEKRNVTVKVDYTVPPQSGNGIAAQVEITDGNAFAVSTDGTAVGLGSDTNFVRAGLRNASDGAGFICHHFAVFD